MTMHLIPQLRKTIGWLLLALVVYPVGVNTAGFFSTFWAVMLYTEDEQLGHAKDLLHWGQAVLPPLSFLYAVAFWHLSKVASSTFSRGVICAVGVVVTAAFYSRYLFPGSMPDQNWEAIRTAQSFIWGLALLFATYVVWRVLRKASAAQPGAPADVPASRGRG